MDRSRLVIVMAMLLFANGAPGGASAQTVLSTSVRAPLVGRLATPAAGQANIGFYGTDLGFTMKHEGQLRILFGDTWANATGIGVDPATDDTQGMICLQASGCPAGVPVFPNGDAVDLYIDLHPPAFGELSWQREGPPVVFPVSQGKVAPIKLFRGPNHTALVSGPFLTPGAAFSNARTGGDSAAYALFGQPGNMACTAAHTCAGGLTCDPDIGDSGNPLAPRCLRGETGCTVGNGYCTDPTSPVRFFPYDARTVRLLRVVFNVEVGNADPSQPQQYFTQQWFTNKFTLPTTTTVNDFEKTRPVGSLFNDWRPPSGSTTEREKVFMWGRPGPIGPQGFGFLYFAFADMPKLKADGSFSWAPQYYAGTFLNVPQFSPNQSDAVPLPLNLDGSPFEQFDIINQMSVRWVDPIKKWVLIYGGDLPSGLLGPVVSAVARRDPSASVHVRFASQPWGPWSPPQTLAVGGNPFVPLLGTMSQAGGPIHNDLCLGFDCSPHETAFDIPPASLTPIGQPGGFPYGVNLIEEWTMPYPRIGLPVAADIYWLVSTWDPYQVVLMRSRIGIL